MRVWSDWYWLTTTLTASEHKVRLGNKDDWRLENNSWLHIPVRTLPPTAVRIVLILHPYPLELAYLLTD